MPFNRDPRLAEADELLQRSFAAGNRHADRVFSAAHITRRFMEKYGLPPSCKRRGDALDRNSHNL